MRVSPTVGESLECVVCLQCSFAQASRPSVAGNASPYFLLNMFPRTNDVDRNACVLGYLSGVAVINFAEGINAEAIRITARNALDRDQTSIVRRFDFESSIQLSRRVRR